MATMLAAHRKTRFSCFLQNFLIICLLMLSTIGAAHASIMGDECDWTGSGLTSSTSQSRGVTPVYLRCQSGRVTWKYPQGALRVLLRLPSGDREFRACIKLRPDGDNKVPARLFLEGPRSLLPLYKSSDGGKQIRCFNSKNNQAAIYVESNHGPTVNREIAEFDYDLQALPRGSKAFDPSEECKPCSEEDLAHLFCTSDLVTRGTIKSIENYENLDFSMITVEVTKLIRHTTNDGYIYDNGMGDEESVENSIELPLLRNEKDKIEVVINVAKSCRVAHGLGEFVFMARRKLGDLTLKCAPRLEDWAFLIHKLTREGKSHCILKS